MKYTANPIEVEAFEITGVGQLHKDGSRSIQILTDEVDEKGNPIHDEVIAASHHKIAVGDYWVLDKDGNASVHGKASFEHHYITEVKSDAVVEEVADEPVVEEPVIEPEVAA